ncbi:MAG: DUF1566 domain-containing protein [bacterium]|nr:MAG: DUF1566 domain-containing protein [bacterium]
MSEQKPKIFLSYAHIDLGYAKKIYDDLKRYGLEIWFDKESLLPGQDWEKEIKKAIRESDYFIALLSDKCLSKRGFVHSALKFSFEIVEKYFPSDTGIFVIPVRLDDCKPSDAYERLGRLHWIDVFPETEYQNGLKKILQVICKEALLLRNKHKALSEGDATEMIRMLDFYDKNKNPEGNSFNHQYKLQEINGNKVVFDQATGLMWQQSGSPEYINYDAAKKYIDDLNQKGFAGNKDWRLPTLEEAMSLMKPEQKHDNLYIDPVFDAKQIWIWTSDQVKGESRAAWVVNFFLGGCGWYSVSGIDYVYVRAVR